MTITQIQKYLRFLNFQKENIVVNNLKQLNPRVICPKDANGMAKGDNPDLEKQSGLSLYCLPSCLSKNGWSLKVAVIKTCSFVGLSISEDKNSLAGW